MGSGAKILANKNIGGVNLQGYPGRRPLPKVSQLSRLFSNIQLRSGIRAQALGHRGNSADIVKEVEPSYPDLFIKASNINNTNWIIKVNKKIRNIKEAAIMKWESIILLLLAAIAAAVFGTMTARFAGDIMEEVFGELSLYLP